MENYKLYALKIRAVPSKRFKVRRIFPSFFFTSSYLKAALYAKIYGNYISRR